MFSAPGRDRAEDVVRLVAGRFQDGDLECAHHLFHALDVAGELGGDIGAGPLVVGVFLVAERRAWRVEGYGHVRGPVVGEGLEERGSEGVDAAHVLAGLPDG